MRQLLVASLLTLLSVPVAHAQRPQIKSGSTVFIEPMGGSEKYFAAAIKKKHVPVVVVLDKNKADYIVSGDFHQRIPNRLEAYGQTSLSISVIEPRSSAVVYAHTASNNLMGNQIKGVAADCAKHLKDFIEKPPK